MYRSGTLGCAARAEWHQQHWWPKAMKTVGNRLSRSLAALVLLGTCSAGIAGSAAAAGLASHAGGRTSSTDPSRPGLPIAALHAKGILGGGAQAIGLVPNPALSRPTPIVNPIVSPPPKYIQLPANVNVPGSFDLQVSASAVTVKWFDRSNNELGFKVFKRDTSGNWQQVYQVATRDIAGTGDGNEAATDYSYVDTSTNLSGQCYEVAAYNSTNSGYAAEECTVRPDPSRFPQEVASAAPQWGGLSNSNDGTGVLDNANMDMNLLYGEQTWGVNLTWGNTSLWRVEAQGGPQLMKGQAVAIKVWGGGWLKYGTQTFGVDLQLSATPVYEWYAIGAQATPVRGRLPARA